MNYKIINDLELLFSFINWLPELVEGECYYVALFARKKYHESAKNDKSQCKRFTATSKEWLLRKLRQLEIRDCNYFNKDASPVHNDALAMYISVNPRSFYKAQKLLLKKLADTLTGDGVNMNPHALAMTAIQKAKSRTAYVDFDFDDVNFTNLESAINDVINREAYSILQTRGGFHLLVDPRKVANEFSKTWYKTLSEYHTCDAKGDNLIPIGGCCQGGFTPFIIK